MEVLTRNQTFQTASCLQEKGRLKRQKETATRRLFFIGCARLCGLTGAARSTLF
ncbi:hypothetical protein [Neisseria elongata]|uniref:hypothetical protein n=1 Tax=Neisseria elongata TaxID=495 RepID=UPI0030C6AF87